MMSKKDAVVFPANSMITHQIRREWGSQQSYGSDAFVCGARIILGKGADFFDKFVAAAQQPVTFETRLSA